MGKVRNFLTIMLLVLMLLMLVGCGEETKQADNRLAEVVTLTDSATAALQAGDVAEIGISPELKLCFLENANMDMWFHLPEFTEGEQPQDLADYWYLVRVDNVTGLDENGYFVVDEERWQTVPEGSELGFVGMPMISAEYANDFVRRHFGAVELQIADHEHKMYDFDGEYLYAYMDGGFPTVFFDLQSLTAERQESGRVVYTAKLDEYGDLAYSEKADKAIAAYMEESEQELTWYQAVSEMMMNDETAAFGTDEELTVRFYIDEETGDTVYLAVDWQQ